MKSFIAILSAFLDLLKQKILPASTKKDSFAFIVHPRSSYDAAKKYPFLKYLPKSIVDLFLKNLWPIVVAEVKGLKSLKNGKKIDGWIIGVPLTPHQMLENRNLAKKRILDAVKLAEKMGVTIVGLGGITASLTEAGHYLANHTNNIGITTGRAYTAYNITANVFQLSKYFNINLSTGKFAIVGGGGSIGLASAEILVRNGVNNLLLVDLIKRYKNAQKIINLLKSLDKDKILNIKFSSKIHDIIDSDIIIAATSAPEAVIRSEDLKPGAIVIDDAQPSDIDPKIIEERDDVLIIQGGVVKTNNIEMKINLGLAGKNDIFNCLAECMALAVIEWKKHYSLGWLNLKHIEEISKIGKSLKFELAPYQNKNGYISEEYLKKIKKIRTTHKQHSHY